MARFGLGTGVAMALAVACVAGVAAAEPVLRAVSQGLPVERLASAAPLTRTAPKPSAPHDPMAAALSAAVARAGAPALAEAYAAGGHALLWLAETDAATDRLRALMAALAAAPAHALPAARYDREGIADQIRALDGAGPEAVAALDIALTETFLAYARDVASGVLEPKRADPEIHHRPERPDPAALVEGLRAAPDPAAMIAALAPRHPDYARLQARLAEYRRLAQSGAWAEPLPSGASIRLGARGPRVEALRRRLIAMGDMPPVFAAEDPDGTVIASNEVMTDAPLRQSVDPAYFDPGLEGAVKRFQARHGLNQDGVVGPATRAALNENPAERMRQIAVNLERLRWMNKDLGRRHVMVNLAGFEMALMEDGAALYTSRVVVGKRRHETPEFSDEMEYLVVNPTWHVPYSIASKEILPKLKEDPTYLARNNMRLEGAGAPAEAIDWSFVTQSSFPGRVKQAPGPGNALGRVKFMFPNKWSIYLHDTPHKSLFRRDRRAYSHGCVRVQDPFAFAHALLAPQTDDPEGFVNRHLRRGREVYVHLDTHVPVHLTYRTAWVDPGGVDQFRGDIYGRDAKVFAALEAAGLDITAE